jgi:hypothetical protein
MMTLQMLQRSYNIMAGFSKWVLCVNYINCITLDSWKNSRREMNVATYLEQKRFH